MAKKLQKIGLEKNFVDVINLIKNAQYIASKSVNRELINLYWSVGKYVSKKIQNAEWGNNIVTNLSEYIQKSLPNPKGFSDKNIWRMKQFYETYQEETILSALLRELSWTNNLLIISRCKSKEEREFYLNLAIKENYSSRELERQINVGYFERVTLTDNSVFPPVVKKLKKDEAIFIKDTYILEFLDLPNKYAESELRKSIVANLKNFILEFGKDFSFIGEEYRIQVGGNDYFIDLLFYHRGLRCLVAIELKVDDFKPEYLGKMNFYLEALDRDVKKQTENPSVGIILCGSKDTDVVEYAMSRNMSPAMVAEYQLKLIDKKILQKKLHELLVLE